MSKTVEEQWQEICQESDEAQDEITRAMSHRDNGIYQNGDFWERLEKAQDKWRSVEKKIDAFKKFHSL